MKKFTNVIMVVLVLCISTCIFVGCAENESKVDRNVTFMRVALINYNEISGMTCIYTKNKEIVVEDGDVIGEVSLNTTYGTGSLYRFVGWFSEKECLHEWNLYKDEVKCDLVLYPKYEKIS